MKYCSSFRGVPLPGYPTQFFSSPENPSLPGLERVNNLHRSFFVVKLITGGQLEKTLVIIAGLAAAPPAAETVRFSSEAPVDTENSEPADRFITNYFITKDSAL